MSKQRGKLVLSCVEEEQLQQLIRAQSTPQGLAKRARVVQLAAQGLGPRQGHRGEAVRSKCPTIEPVPVSRQF